MNLNKLLVCFSLVVIGGCSTSIIEPIHKATKAVQIETEKHNNAVGSVKPVRHSVISKLDGYWVPLHVIPAKETSLPSEFAKQYSIDREFTSITEVAERITALSGIPVSLSPDSFNTASGGSQQQPVQQSAVGMPPPVQGGPLPQGGIQSMSNPSLPIGGGIQLAYTGNLGGFMDLACARFGLNWEYRDNQVVIFRTITKTFVVYALPGDTTLDSKISNQSAGGGASSAATSSNSTHNTGVSFTGLSVWTAIDQSIKGMITTYGKVAVTPATGTVTVTDVPYAVSRIGRFIAEQNKSLARQVVLNVKVLSVSVTNSDNYGINWNLVYNTVSKNVGATFASNFPQNIAASALKLSVLPASKGVLSGSDAIVSAISQQGNVSLVTSAKVTTLNNQAVPVQVGKQTAYLASSSTTNTPNVGTTASLTPGVVTTGFSMNLLPHVLEEGRMLLQYAIDLSTLNQLVTVNSGGSSIQTPEIQTRNFMQRVAVHSGETLVLSGFEQTENSANTQGTGSASNTWLGGGVTGKKTHDVIVVLVTPEVADKF